MSDVYKECPVIESDNFKLRLLEEKDCGDLLKIYSDTKAVPFFNSDNCDGDDFHYTTEKRMKEAVDFWLYAYKNGWFVRFSIIDKAKDEVIGTIEMLNRLSEDFFNGFGLLRLDLRSDYEKADLIYDMLMPFIKPSMEMFNCSRIASKTFENGNEREAALKKLGFSPTDEKIIGKDGTIYNGYWVTA